MKPIYHAITFGPSGDPNKYWNHITHHSTQKAAERWALDNKCVGGILGYVVIEEGEDFWDIVDEMGTENLKISTSRLGQFKIQPKNLMVV